MARFSPLDKKKVWTREDILKDHSARICKMADYLSKIILKAVPDACERIYPVWHALGYRHARAGYFCGIFPLRNEVRLIFERGIELSHLHKNLQGTGKQVRYLSFKDIQDIFPEGVEKIVLDAVKTGIKDKKTR